MPASKTEYPFLHEGKSWPFKITSATRSLQGIKVSVVIPSFNQGQFLEATIRSVLLQDYPNIECLILDAGSKDESQAIIEHYREHLSYVRIGPDDGQSAAVNEGLRNATGDLLAFLNSDDMLTQGSIRKIVRAFQRNPETALIHGDRILISESDKVLGWTYDKNFQPDRNLGSRINSETAFWKREWIDRIGYFNESFRFALDHDYFTRIYLAGGQFRKLNEFIGFFRVHLNAKSATMVDVCEAETQLINRTITLKPSLPDQHPQMRRIAHYLMALKHFNLVFLPWLTNRFKSN